METICCQRLRCYHLTHYRSREPTSGEEVAFEHLRQLLGAKPKQQQEWDLLTRSSIYSIFSPFLDFCPIVIGSNCNKKYFKTKWVCEQDFRENEWLHSVYCWFGGKRDSQNRLCTVAATVSRNGRKLRPQKGTNRKTHGKLDQADHDPGGLYCVCPKGSAPDLTQSSDLKHSSQNSEIEFLLE